MPAVTYAMKNGTWHAINFDNKAYAKFGGAWLDMSTNSRKIHVKNGGSWVETYPSELDQWTAYQTGASATQGASASPALSTDPDNVYTNITTASDPVGWDGRSSGSGQKAQVRNFGWTEDIPGVAFGAVDRARVTYSQKYLEAPDPGNFLRTGIGFDSELGISTGTLTGSYAVVTIDRPIDAAGWLLSFSQVGDLFDGSLDAYISGVYDNASDSSDKESVIKSFQVGLHYLYN